MTAPQPRTPLEQLAAFAARPPQSVAQQLAALAGAIDAVSTIAQHGMAEQALLRQSRLLEASDTLPPGNEVYDQSLAAVRRLCTDLDRLTTELALALRQVERERAQLLERTAAAVPVPPVPPVP